MRILIPLVLVALFGISGCATIEACDEMCANALFGVCGPSDSAAPVETREANLDRGMSGGAVAMAY